MKESRLAAKKGELDTLKRWCLENPDEIHRSDPIRGQTLLHIAAKYCQLPVVQYLLTLGLKVNEPDNRKNTPLGLCLQSQNKLEEKVGIMERLLEAKADPLTENFEYRSPYMSFMKMCGDAPGEEKRRFAERLTAINRLVKHKITERAKTVGPFYHIQKTGKVQFFKTQEELTRDATPTRSPAGTPPAVSTPPRTPSPSLINS
ncbi:MAG: ankyrin repeat domain-containing protein [Proteobacteria bacterium]|nr:ankyrin repeat domain-containing protein [Pseudomonadota bacterium]